MVSFIKTLMLWLLCVALYVVLLVFTVVPMAFIVPLFTRAQDDDGVDNFTWGFIWGTYDNPPQGDRGYLTKHAWFIGHTTGWRGYINRVGWMLRNPLYGYSKAVSVWYRTGDRIVLVGREDISDKHGIPGTLITKVYDRRGRWKAFELYVVWPWSSRRNLRMRLGWKAKSRKVDEMGIMQFVFTINPFDGYNNDK